jgi:hypothetical protein
LSANGRDFHGRFTKDPYDRACDLIAELRVVLPKPAASRLLFLRSERVALQAGGAAIQSPKQTKNGDDCRASGSSGQLVWRKKLRHYMVHDLPEGAKKGNKEGTKAGSKTDLYSTQIIRTRP